MDWMPRPKRKKIGGGGGAAQGWKWTFGRGPVLVARDIWRNRKREEDEVGNVVISIRQSGRREPHFSVNETLKCSQKTWLVFITPCSFGRRYHFYKSGRGVCEMRRRGGSDEKVVVRDWFTMSGLKSGLWSCKALAFPLLLHICNF
jgi:hypothetical protein